jgi:hypothetical protein
MRDNLSVSEDKNFFYWGVVKKPYLDSLYNRRTKIAAIFTKN